MTYTIVRNGVIDASAAGGIRQMLVVAKAAESDFRHNKEHL